MHIDLSDRVERHLAFGSYERHELRVMKRLLRAGDVMIDAGAHVGYFALHAAKWVTPSGSVHAFEPAAANARRLRRNAELNGLDNLLVREAAVAETTGTTTFFEVVHEGESGWGSLMIDPSETTREVRVPAVALDDYVGTNSLSPRLIKLDVQGAEMSALQGAKTTLQTHRPAVLCEVVDVYWGASQTTVTADIFRFMESLGYVARPVRGLLGRGQVMNALFAHRSGS